MFIVTDLTAAGVTVLMPGRPLAAGGAFLLLVVHRPHASLAVPQGLLLGGIQRPIQLRLYLGKLIGLQAIPAKRRRQRQIQRQFTQVALAQPAIEFHLQGSDFFPDLRQRRQQQHETPAGVLNQVERR